MNINKKYKQIKKEYENKYGDNVPSNDDLKGWVLMGKLLALRDVYENQESDKEQEESLLKKKLKEKVNDYKEREEVKKEARKEAIKEMKEDYKNSYKKKEKDKIEGKGNSFWDKLSRGFDIGDLGEKAQNNLSMNTGDNKDKNNKSKSKSPLKDMDEIERFFGR